MIPLHKLATLPRSQRLRKIARIFAEVEYRLSRGESPNPETIAYLADTLRFLIRDDAFSPTVQQAFNAAFGGLQAEAPEETRPPSGGLLVRAINTVRHILLAETGQQTADWDFVDHRGRLEGEKRRSFAGMRVYLEDIRSPFNVGAMFRTAESFGVEKLYLSPLCADPHHPRAERTAMGCVAVLPWERLPSAPFLAPEAEPLDRAPIPEGPLFALETGGVDLTEFSFPAQGTMIAGSEELGVSPEALAAADASLGRVSIPTYGAKGSLNVSVAFGIALRAWAVFLAGK
jgi:TrmH family RNA methyltransferase